MVKVEPKPGKTERALRYAPGRKYEVLERQLRIAELYAGGWSQAEIADMVGVVVSTVNKDLKKIKQRWIDSANVAMAERKARELDRIDWMEREAQDSWELSKRDAEVKKVTVEKAMRVVNESIPDGKTPQGRKKGDLKGQAMPTMRLEPVRRYVERSMKGQTGDVRYLQTIAWCIEMRLKIFGVLNEDKTQVNILNMNWDDIHSKMKPVDVIAQRLKDEEKRIPQLGQ